jgi:O-antigen ligase
MLYLLKIIYGLLLPLIFFFPRISVFLLIIITIQTAVIVYQQQRRFRFEEYVNKNTLLYSAPVLLFVLWSAISCSWSPYPLQSLSSLFAFLGLIAIGMTHVMFFSKLEHSAQKQIIYVLLIGTLIAAIIMLADSLGSSPWSNYKGFNKEKLYAKVAMGISFTGLLGWHYIKQRLYKTVFTITIVSALFYSDCDAAILAYFSGLLFYILRSIPQLQRPIRVATLIFVPICFLLLPFMILKSGMNRDVILNWNQQNILTHNSSLHRLVILSDTAESISKNPILGYGYNTSKFDKINGGDKSFLIFDHNNPETPLVKLDYKAIHPHNFIMQLWLELGLIGVLLWLAFTLIILNIMAKNLNYLPLAFSLFLCGHIHLLVSIGLWQSWWWALIFIIAPFSFFFKNK